MGKRGRSYSDEIEPTVARWYLIVAMALERLRDLESWRAACDAIFTITEQRRSGFEQGRLGGVVAGPPCSSWSAARARVNAALSNAAMLPGRIYVGHAQEALGIPACTICGCYETFQFLTDEACRQTSGTPCVFHGR